MKAYADTGWLCSLYAPDAHSKIVMARMRRQELPLPIVWLHQIEFRNALRLRVFRKEITPEQRDASLNAMLADIAVGAFETLSPPFSGMMIEAERLSATYTETFGARSLDILHVASAVVLGMEEFLTFDLRQGALAKAAGLKTPRPPRR